MASISIHTATIALGSNVGDRFYNIELALRLLEIPQVLLNGLDASRSTHSAQDPVVTVVDTSFLYETAPMYVKDQPAFINCACVVETNLLPSALLILLKKIESDVGRVPTIRNGPRVVDLDIILYDDDILDTRESSQKSGLDNLEGELVIPHPRMAEREFVLRPLNDMIPRHVHPVLQKSISTLLAELPIAPEEPPMQKVVPFPRYPLAIEGMHSSQSFPTVPPTLTHWVLPSIPTATRKSNIAVAHSTHVMATLNTTPDSFSDGSDHRTLITALGYAREAVAAGASIIDIGGYSTRPGAAFVNPDEEIKRVVPVITAIRDIPADDNKTAQVESQAARVKEVPISVDTFRSEVAEASIMAGANCINDVYAFTGHNSYMPIGDVNEKEVRDHMDSMKKLSRNLAVPVILMHSRGDAGQNKDYGKYAYAGDQETVIEGVRLELGAKLDRIVKGKGAVRRWMVIVDPGIGFSKTLEGNLEVLRNAAAVVADVDIGESSNRRRNPLAGHPMLIGASRKSFLGAILARGETGRSTTPKERIFATATAVSCAIQQGAAVVRVHDTKEMIDCVRIADALWCTA